MNEPAHFETDYQLLALDVGRRRIGVARAQSRARLVEPLAIIKAGEDQEFAALAELFAVYQPALLIVGLPYDSSGAEGEQAIWIKQWVATMLEKTEYTGQLIYQDETLSTKAAEAAGGAEGFVDDLAASIILEDYLNEETERE